MANTVTGRIYGISPTQNIHTKGGKTFVKREVIIDTTRFDPYTGERDAYENFPMIEFTGEKCSDLDAFQVGQIVTITFDLQGGFYDATDGTRKNLTKVRGYKIEAKQLAKQPQPKPQPAPQPQQAPHPTHHDLPW